VELGERYQNQNWTQEAAPAQIQSMRGDDGQCAARGS
jgi:hypothetical protein